MNIKYKILTVLGLCALLCLSSYFIISRMFDNLENQLFEKCRIEALIGAKTMSETINIIIETGLLRENDIFDTKYIEIPGNNPKKYNTRYDGILTKYIQSSIDEFLMDPDITYAVLVDKNGYAPTHNLKFLKNSKKFQAQDVRLNRAKRIFSDPVGIKAAQYNAEGTIKQLYYRDTGETMWDIAASVKIHEKHWGAFRVGVSLDRIDEIKNQMIILIGMSMLVIVSITMLLLFLIIPRKLYDTDLNIRKYQ